MVGEFPHPNHSHAPKGRTTASTLTLQGGRGQFLYQDEEELAKEIWGGSCDGVACGTKKGRVHVRVVREEGEELGVRVSLNTHPCGCTRASTSLKAASSPEV